MLSPGVPLTHPEPHWTVKRAQAAGVPVVGDIELFARERAARAPDAPVRRDHRHERQVDHHRAHRPRAEEAGRDVALGGNIGVPVLDLPPPTRAASM